MTLEYLFIGAIALIGFFVVLLIRMREMDEISKAKETEKIVAWQNTGPTENIVSVSLLIFAILLVILIFKDCQSDKIEQKIGSKYYKRGYERGKYEMTEKIKELTYDTTTNNTR